MYQKSHQRIEQADCDTDLRFWSENHGVDMGMTWPVFQVDISILQLHLIWFQ